MNENDFTALIPGPETAAQKEARAFVESELIACDACSRVNPPTRAACLYCGAQLRARPAAVSDQPLSTIPGSADKPEHGFQVVLISAGENPGEPAIAEAAALLDLNSPELSGIVNAGSPLPLAHSTSAEHAMALSERLRALGFETVTVEEQDSSSETSIRRVRAIELLDDTLSGVTVSGGAQFSARWDAVELIVAGRLMVNRVEIEERQRRGRKQMVDTRELSADEAVLDLYASSDVAGWRIVASNFDFSCLGSAKSMTAFANFKALVDMLRSRAPNAIFDDAYVRLRPALTCVWPVEPQTRRGDWRRSGAGKFDVATVTTTDNEAQFTRYSRLRRSLLRKSENGN